MNHIIIDLLNWYSNSVFEKYYSKLCLLNKDFYNTLQNYENPIIYDYNKIKLKKFPKKISKIINFKDDINILKKYKITHLTFGYNFNQPVDNLPMFSKADRLQTLSLYASSIKHLTFGNNFNQPVDNLPTPLRI